MEIWQLTAVEKAMAQDHVQLVRNIAGRMARAYPRFAPREDLEAHGMLGLLRAARRFVAGGEATFATYAAYRIRGAMLDALKQIAPIPRSYELPHGDESDDDVYGLVEVNPETAIIEGVDGARARALLAELPVMQRRLLLRVYFQGKDLAHAAAELGKSKSWGCRTHAAALRRLYKRLSRGVA